MKKEVRKNPNRVKKIYLLNIIALCCLVLLSVLSAVLIYQRYYAAERELKKTQVQLEEARHDNTVYTQEDLDARVNTARLEGNAEQLRMIRDRIREAYTDGESTLGVLRDLFNEELVVKNGGTYAFVPILQELDRSGFKPGDFIPANGIMRYVGSRSSVRLTLGIDVSAENGDIDWEKVAEDQVTFAMLRAAYRPEGGENDSLMPLQKDEYFEENLTGARSSGIRAGAYFVLDAVSRKEAAEEADEVIRILNGAGEENAAYTRTEKINSYVAVVVPVPLEEERTYSLTEAEWTEYAAAACERIRGAGYEPLICGNLNALVTQLDLKKVQNFGKWVINYDNDPYYPYPFSLWRYSMSGMIDGIEGPVNLDVEIH